jgi:hypothetical protein
MAELVKAPNFFDLTGKVSVFLAGSIEMGKAEDWQTKLWKYLKDMDELVVLNPRRDDWDDSWEQKIENKQFNEQVTWELSSQEQADVIAMYFDPTTKAPISLLELGLFGEEGKMIVCCPEGFYRKGNVDIVCKRYNIEQVENIEALMGRVKEVLVEVQNEKMEKMW